MKVEVRKGKADSVRNQGFIPGVIYGNKFDAQSVKAPYMEFKKALHEYGNTKTFSIKIDGESHIVYIKDAQPTLMNQNEYIHFDLVKVKADDTLQAEVALHFNGREGLRGSGLVFTSNLDEILVEYGVGSGVAYIDVDVSGLTENEPIHVSDIVLPEGVKVLEDPNRVVCSLVQASSEEAPETDDDEQEGVIYDTGADEKPTEEE